MANPDHIAQLMKGVTAWNAWREENPRIDPDLSHGNLSDANLSKANLRKADLSGAMLNGAQLSEADLSDADLSLAILTGANLGQANLFHANLLQAILMGANVSGANLRGAELFAAQLMGADLSEADLSRAWLSGAQLSNARLCEANLRGASFMFATLANADLRNADLTGCCIYGVSAWGVKLDGAKQQNLIITPADEPEITVDNIEVAQFIYLLLNNEKIREVIDTITSKAVLILGRFTDERKAVLDAIREKLRERGYLPILFDFQGPLNRHTDETVTLLAHMARFVIADISDAKSVLQELRAIVPNLPSVPVQPVIVATQEEPGMFDFYRPFPWFLKVHRYGDKKQLIADLSERVIRSAETKVQELRQAKGE
jgi:uncharacterized protein YjbI with pentapeptide repeats